MTEPVSPPRQEHFGPLTGNWRTRSLALLAGLSLTALLQILQHNVLMSLSYTSYHLVTALVQALIITTLIFVYFRWRRYAQRVQQALTKLRESESLRDDMTAMLVHDLKNPLISATMALQNVDRRQSAISCMSEEEMGMLALARESQVRLLGMIEDLLDVARAESGELELVAEPVDLCETSGKAVNEAKGLAERADIELTLECREPLIEVIGDDNKLRRVADNLLTNAVKFTPTGGKVWVRVWQDQAGVHLQIQDTGPGIPREMQAWVFDKFTQVRTGQRYSVGLGLTFSKYAVEAHGGTIKLDSEPGQGSTFTVTLPKATGETSTE